MAKWIVVGVLALTVGCASATEPKNAKRPPAKPVASSGQVFCGPQGCRPVSPGCHIEQRVYLGMSGTNNIEVC
jgi:hypothetical protein